MDSGRPDYYWEIKKIISGKWAIPAHVAHVQKFMWIAER